MRVNRVRRTAPSMARRMRAPSVHRRGDAFRSSSGRAVPLVSSGQTSRIASLQSKIEKKRSAVEAQEEPRARALRRGLRPTRAGSTACRPTSRCCSASRCRIQASLDAKRDELARIQSDLRQERAAPDAPARPAWSRPAGARQPAGRALQGRPARPRHGRPRVRRLRRPARAHRVHAARLQPGRSASSRSCARPRSTRRDHQRA